MRISMAMGTVVIALLFAGCQSQQQMVDEMQADATQVAKQRGKFELNCPTATAQVLSKEMIQSEVMNPRWAPPQRAEYTLGSRAAISAPPTWSSVPRAARAASPQARRTRSRPRRQSSSPSELAEAAVCGAACLPDERLGGAAREAACAAHLQPASRSLRAGRFQFQYPLGLDCRSRAHAVSLPG